MVQTRETAQELTFRAILNDQDNWQRYQDEYAGEVTADQIAEVEKMLGCGDPRNGFATYICLTCGEQVRVPFSCKSRVCSSCGKVYADEWARQLVGRMFNVTHRHVTLTVPAELWPELEDEAEWRKELFAAANATLRKVLKSEPGIVMVMHPYGKDLKANYHLHVLVTEGGLDEAGEWQAQPYLSYKALRKVWQYEILTRLRAVMPRNAATKRMIDSLFRRYGNGFYVHAEPRVKEGAGISRYIGRYIRHPAIADARIVAYDGERVTFYYEEREGARRVRRERTVPVLEFIHGVVRHIPPKQFKMVRYFGLYAPRKASRVREIMERIGQAFSRTVRRLSWRERIRRDFHRDPLACPSCGEADMELYSLTVPWKGRLITIGGLDWLLERGIIIELMESVPSVRPGQSIAQLALPF